MLGSSSKKSECKLYDFGLMSRFIKNIGFVFRIPAKNRFVFSLEIFNFYDKSLSRNFDKNVIANFSQSKESSRSSEWIGFRARCQESVHFIFKQKKIFSIFLSENGNIKKNVQIEEAPQSLQKSISSFDPNKIPRRNPR
ncbi:hypothetical protein LEP1GSC108_4231 [Leptospira weilii str. UI 13098]|uniref:Uncharacterized protein n=1 Tax=Leptospira weilii str. UI 13098 TaxID=1088542 RepID=M6Q701_9LEPT|nr:hypothetical protein LEP1GSC108_4231 [Leptospira weilii str. UI 13098]